MLVVALAVAAALVALAFCMSTLDRWLTKRRPYELVWTLAFAQFALAAVFMAAGAEAGWSSFTFKGFYLFGAILDVAFLGLGQLMLMTSETFARRSTQAVVVFAAFATGILAASPLTNPLPEHGLAQGSAVFDAGPRILAAVGSGLGATIVVVGTVLSAYRRRNKAAFIGNGLIALGTLVSGASGILNSVFDKMTAFSVTLTVGIALIFLGFLVVTSHSRVTESVPNSTDSDIDLRSKLKKSRKAAIKI